MGTAVLVERQNIAATRIIQKEAATLSDGSVRVKIQNFSITANNVTYAAIGDMHGYWGFFPHSDVEGIVPVWGHGVVEASNHPDVAAGERLYGYFPMASHLDMLVGEVTYHQISEISPHRQPMSPFYNQYSRLAAELAHDPAQEGIRNLFDPLFRTSFLIEAMFNSADWFGAAQLLITSASSKTALALAHVTRDKTPHIVRIGLTSKSNLDFVTRTELYNIVIAYEDLDHLAKTASIIVDFAGNAVFLASIRTHFADALMYNCLVGATHVNTLGQQVPDDLPGPEPILFFAPDHATAVIEEIGPSAFAGRVSESWIGFVADTNHFVTIEHRKGLEAAAQAFVATVQGIIKPDTGIVIEL